MASYYYFGATLPSLAWRGVPPFGFASWIERCSIHLSKRDLESVEGARLYVPADGSLPVASRGSRLLGGYYRWELALRNELVRLRAGRLGVQPERHLRPGDVEWDALKAAQAAFQAESPLEGELIVERERWLLLDRLQVGHWFDLEALLAYGLRLQTLERVARFETELGRATYGTAYSEILGASGAPGDAGTSGSASDDTGDVK